MLTVKTLILALSTCILGGCSPGSQTEEPALAVTTSDSNESFIGSAINAGVPESDSLSMANPVNNAELTVDILNSQATDFLKLVGIWDSSQSKPTPYTEYVSIDQYGTMTVLDYQGDADNGAGAQNCFDMIKFNLATIPGETDLYLLTYQGLLSSGFSGQFFRYLQVNNDLLTVAEPRHAGETLGEPSELIKDPEGNVQLANIQFYPRLAGIDPVFNECV